MNLLWGVSLLIMEIVRLTFSYNSVTGFRMDGLIMLVQICTIVQVLKQYGLILSSMYLMKQI